MEKLRSRPAYSIVAELRSTALRRVTNHVLGHRQARALPSCPCLLKPEKIKGLNLRAPKRAKRGSLTSCSTATTGLRPPAPMSPCDRTRAWARVRICSLSLGRAVRANQMSSLVVMHRGTQLSVASSSGTSCRRMARTRGCPRDERGDRRELRVGHRGDVQRSPDRRP